MRARFGDRAAPVRSVPQPRSGPRVTASWGALAASDRPGEVSLTLGAAGPFSIREGGAVAVASREEDLLTCERSDGHSFWAATPAGAEEWLLVFSEGDRFSTSWEVTGATLRVDAQRVELVEPSGQVRALVTAPAAWTASGRVLRPALSAQGSTLSLGVEGVKGEWLLVDPLWAMSNATMLTARTNYAMTLLPNGKVLVTGGYDAISTTGNPLSAAELYDPATGRWTATRQPMAYARAFHTATLLPNGQVLIGPGGGAISELYDPASDQFFGAASLRQAHQGQSATLLSTGQVLLAGGGTNDAGATELYDPDAGWSDGPSMAAPRFGHAAIWTDSTQSTLLVCGGGASLLNSATVTPSCETYDTINGFQPYGTMSLAVAHFALCRQHSGEIIEAGGLTNGAGVSSNTYVLHLGSPPSWSLLGSLPWQEAEMAATITPNDDFILQPSNGAQLYADVRTMVGDGGAWTYLSANVSVARAEGAGAMLPSGKWLSGGGTTRPQQWNFAVAASDVLDTSSPGFVSSPSALPTGVWGHTATVLPTGEVLVAGGVATGTAAVPLAALYDGGAFYPAPSLPQGRVGHTATLLFDGRVLVAGGTPDLDGGVALNSALLFDPTTARWVSTGAMTDGRWDHRATLLRSGKVLVVGGVGDAGVSIGTAELYDPASGSWSGAGSLTQARFGHVSRLLSDGRVLVAGARLGAPGSGSALVSSALYDPASGLWTPTGALPSPLSDGTATLLPSGAVLWAGDLGTGTTTPANSAYLFDPQGGTWSSAGTLQTARAFHAAALLPNGSVLLIGGRNGSGPIQAAELYAPETSSFTPVTSPTARDSATATLLASGQVLVVGGVGLPNSLASTDLFDEGRGASAASAPRINPVAPLLPGAVIGVQGTRLTGTGEPSCGRPGQSSVNFPLIYLERLDGEQRTIAPTSHWDAVSTQAAIPSATPPGWSWVRPVAAGVAGEAAIALVTTGQDSGAADGGAGGDAGAATDAGAPDAGGSPDAGRGPGDGGGPGADGGVGSADGGVGTAPVLFGCYCGAGGRWPAGTLAILALALLGASRRRHAAACCLLLALPLAARAAAPAKVAVLQISAGPGVSSSLIDVITDSLNAELQHRGLAVVSTKDIQAQLGFERQKQLLGCADQTACFAEIGQALGVDRLVTGSMAKLGGSVVLNLQVLDARTASVQSRFSRRVKDATDEAFLDSIALAADALFPDVPAPRDAHAPSGGMGAPGAELSSGPSTAEANRPGLGLDLTLQGRVASFSPARGADDVFVGYRLMPALAVEAGILVAKPLGAELRASWIPFNATGRLRPVLAIEVPVLFSSPTSVGVGGSVGLDVLVLPWLSVGAEMPVVYLVAAPAGSQAFWVFGAAHAGVHL